MEGLLWTGPNPFSFLLLRCTFGVSGAIFCAKLLKLKKKYCAKTTTFSMSVSSIDFFNIQLKSSN